jgi:ADP-ribosylglycohydrolase
MCDRATNRIPDDYIERCYAGWLGKVIGVRHGAPIEGWTYDQILNLIGEIDGYIVDYRDFAADDDTNGPMFFIRALDDYASSRELTPEHIGLTWLNYTPYEHGFYWWGGYGVSTEHTAYSNLRAGIMAPRSGSIEQNGKTVAEQIGGQIFVDTWGLMNPNNPSLAAEYAKKAASVSHDGNGIYGGMFIASAISAAFVAKSIDEIIDRALAEIPADCEYARMVCEVRAYQKRNRASDWRACFRYIEANWGYQRYPGNCHIIPNAAVIVMSLQYSEGSFDSAINICNMAGWDTDCNVGNVGCIMGTFVGLDQIDYDKWRKPINDFLAASSVVGCLNIMDIPGCVRTIARHAYNIAREHWDAKWDSMLGDDAAQFHFALPASTHAFRIEGAKEMRICHDNKEMHSGSGCLKALFKPVNAGDELKIFYRTYYRPEQFHDSRFDPAFSPVLYPGQTISATVKCQHATKCKAQLFVLDGNSGQTIRGDTMALREAEWTRLSFEIPALVGACIEKAGILLTPMEAFPTEAVVYLDEMRFEGAANYTLDFSKERIEHWTVLHKEVSQMTRIKGIWDLEDGTLSGSCSDFGESYTGDLSWRDYETSFTLAPMNSGTAGCTFRTQGAIRGYSVIYDRRKLLLQKNENGYRTLCSIPYEWPTGEFRRLIIRVQRQHIEVRDQERILMEFDDDVDPYLNGCVGLRVERGGRLRCKRLSVKCVSS